MTYHYVVSFTGTAVAVYREELREHAFENAERRRARGVACEVFTRDGERLSAGKEYKGRDSIT